MLFLLAAFLMQNVPNASDPSAHQEVATAPAPKAAITDAMRVDFFQTQYELRIAEDALKDARVAADMAIKTINMTCEVGGMRADLDRQRRPVCVEKGGAK